MKTAADLPPRPSCCDDATAANRTTMQLAAGAFPLICRYGPTKSVRLVLKEERGCRRPAGAPFKLLCLPPRRGVHSQIRWLAQSVVPGGMLVPVPWVVTVTAPGSALDKIPSLTGNACRRGRSVVFDLASSGIELRCDGNRFPFRPGFRRARLSRGHDANGLQLLL
jgi:hypothetical protein